jgi:hypothetical protein
VQQDVVDVSETETQDKETPVRVVGHRKDNSEWGKRRMEKTLAEIEKRKVKADMSNTVVLITETEETEATVTETEAAVTEKTLAEIEKRKE